MAKNPKHLAKKIKEEVTGSYSKDSISTKNCKSQNTPKTDHNSYTKG